MSRIHVNHIRTALLNLFEGKIDLLDYTKKTEEEKKKSFNSRALAAYSIHIIASSSIEEAANAITDGFDDNGIDAVYYDEQQNTLFLIQSKFIEEGVGEPETGDLRKFRDGIIDLIEERYERFNEKLKSKLSSQSKYNKRLN